MNRFLRLAAVLLLLAAFDANAGNLLMVRSELDFPEAMLELQTAIGEQGYTLSRVQRVDIGLTASGYATDKYRVVFFGRPQEVRRLSQDYPQMIPFLPLKMTIFAEAHETLVVTTDPIMYLDVADTPAVRAAVADWRRDVQAILDRVGGLR